MIYFLVSVFLSSIQIVCYVVVPLMLPAINSLIDPNAGNQLFPNLSEFAQIGIIIAILFTICLISIVIGFIGNNFSVRFANYTSINIRNMMYSNIQKFSLVDVENFSQSSIINRLTIDVNSIATALEFFARVLIRSFVLYIGGLIGLILLTLMPSGSIAYFNNMGAQMPSYSIVLIVIGISIALLLTIGFLIFISIKYFKQTQTNLDNINFFTQENILGQRTVKSFNLQNNQFKTFDKSNEQLRLSSSRAGFVTSALPTCVYFFLDSSSVLATWLSNSEIVEKLMSLFLLISLIIMGLLIGIFGIIQVSRAIPSFHRILEVINYEPSIKFVDKESKLDSKNTIELKNVSFKYPNSDVNSLENINIKIKDKEIIGLIGPTGSGKTTLLSLLSRLYDPTKGEIKLCGENIKKFTKHQIKSIISVCPQTVVLFEGTIKSNILFGKSDATNSEIEQAAKSANLYDFIMSKEKQYDSKVAQRGNNLSGGQKQRLSIARSLIKHAPFLILDDSTSALDMMTEREICQDLIKNKKKQTILIAAQRVTAIKDSDRIIVMDKGKIISFDTHINLLKNCEYYREIAIAQMGESRIRDEINS